MKQLLNLHGIVTVLNTPFTSKLEIDYSALAVNVQIAIDAGIAGFLVPAMASEVNKLTEFERFQMVKTVLDVVPSKIPVIGGASAPTAEERLRIGRQLKELGCDGVLANIPYVSDIQYKNDAIGLGHIDPPFLMLQDWSESGYGIPVPLIVELFEIIPCFRAIKVEVIPAGVKYSAILAATNGQLHVSGGWAVMQMIEALDRGVHAFMPTGMHRIYSKIYGYYKNGQRQEAVKLFHALLPILAFSNQHLDISIHFFKRLLWKQGIYPTALTREPILPFDLEHQRLADELIELINSLEAGIE